MMSALSIPTIHYEKAFVRPGETIRWTVVVHSENTDPVTAEVVSKISHVDQTLGAITKEVSIHEGDQEVNFEWIAPLETPRGYGLDVSIISSAGNEYFEVSSGFDVLDTWTQMPRYGFLSDFEPGRSNAAQTLQALSDLHINGLQYYDWMYRHDNFLTDHDPYTDPLGRTLSLKTVNELIEAGHKHNIAAMPYTAIYAASMEFFNDHKDWALYHADGSPVYLGTNFLAYMDPRPDSEWTKHLLGEFKNILENTKFDGIHLDQYGDPKEANDAKGARFKLDEPIAATITRTHEVVDQYRTDGAVVFNCVTNWPVELASQADEDIIYIEVWAPYTSFSDLHTLVSYAQSQGTGKPVVLAAYVHPGNSANPFLMDALIFASGGGHIELGETSGYLANPYFPDYDTLTTEQTELLKNYYDFAVRYQNIIGPSTIEATKNWRGKIKINGLKVGLNPTDDVFALVRESDSTIAVNLINLTGINSDKWNEPVDFPVPADNIIVKVGGFTQVVKDVYLSSPDEETFSLDPVDFTQNGDEISLVIPSLKIWDLVVFKY